MSNKKLQTIKNKMLKYRDFYGGDLLDVALIEGAKNEDDLRKILYSHETHMEMMLSDALQHINEFRKELKL